LQEWLKTRAAAAISIMPIMNIIIRIIMNMVMSMDTIAVTTNLN
jgi:hypothetical protein